MATRGTDAPKAPRKRGSQGVVSARRASSPKGEISHEARYLMIQEAAYWRAERRGFAPGFELDDWLAAESEVDALLRSDPSSPQHQ